MSKSFLLFADERLTPNTDDVMTINVLMLKKISKVPFFVSLQKSYLKFDIFDFLQPHF